VRVSRDRVQCGALGRPARLVVLDGRPAGGVFGAATVDRRYDRRHRRRPGAGQPHTHTHTAAVGSGWALAGA